MISIIRLESNKYQKKPLKIDDFCLYF